MNRPVAAVAGGVAGMGLMTLLLLLFEVETRSRIGLFDAVARFVGLPGETFLGFVIFLLAGVFAWPLLFVALENHIPWPDDHAARGVLFASTLWIPFVLLGRGEVGGPLLVVYVGFTYLAHVAYGFTLGAVYARLADAISPPTRSVEDFRVG